MNEKRYLKSYVKSFDTKYGDGFNISINKEDFNKLNVDEKGNVRLTMRKRQDLGKYGETHYIVENNYKKDEKKEEKKDDNDLPF